VIFLAQRCKADVAVNMRTTFNAAGITIHLFKNDWPEDCDPVIGDLDECDFDGYAAVNLGSTWAAATYAAGAYTTVSSAVATFTHGGGSPDNDVYGYYATRTDDGSLQWVERNPAAPVLMQAGSPPYLVVATWSEGQWNLEVCPV